MLRDSDTIVEHLNKKLGIGFNETTPDGKFTLKEGECMGTCGGAPLFHINNTRMCEFLTPEKVDQILEELK
jgi:NADH-quinone oxidoreductase subunit E